MENVKPKIPTVSVIPTFINCEGKYINRDAIKSIEASQPALHKIYLKDYNKQTIGVIDSADKSLEDIAKELGNVIYLSA